MNMSILVSKDASGPQPSGPYLSNKLFLKTTFNYPLEIFFLYTFLKSFVFLADMVLKSAVSNPFGVLRLPRPYTMAEHLSQNCKPNLSICGPP